ncbi:MAG: transglycosylase family protein [Pseudonocardiaceae bacterium]
MRNRSRALLSAGLAAGALSLTATGVAVAEPDWDELAECESSGDWSIDTGNGYHGGIQFSDPTWDAYGGEAYASSADQATREQQIAVGREVLAGQGYGAWPGCSASTGWEGGGSSARSEPATGSGTESASQSQGSVTDTQPSAPAVQRITVPHQSVATLNGAPKVAPPGGSLWTVARGDTLTSIAAHTKTDWQEIQRLNSDVVEHADWIFLGERLAIPAPAR